MGLLFAVKTSRFRHSYRGNASKLHRKVGDILRTSDLFKNYPSYQEYPVNKVNPDHHTGRHHFDWVIPALKVVIECHGRQHYEPVAFDGDMDKAIVAYQNGIIRDNMKREAAESAGWKYIIVKWDEEKHVTADDIFAKIKEAKSYEVCNSKSTRSDEAYKSGLRAARSEYLKSDRHKEELRRAREYRREQYRRLKEKNGPRQ
jgi:very-short-patch-repair endonuclease